MAKEKLKREVLATQDNICVHCHLALSDEEMALIDTHRKQPKRDGGTYTDENTVVEHPVCHMKAHGIFKSRLEDFEELKKIFDDRSQTMKFKLKVNNQMLAFERKVDDQGEETLEWLQKMEAEADERLKEIDKPFEKKIKEMAKVEPLIAASLSAPGCGPVTAGAMAIYIDLTEAKHASSLWKYVGLDKPSHERYTKGEASGGNKTLRTVLYNFACSCMKMNHGNPYREIYDRVKDRLAQSEKITKSRNTQGKLVEIAWKDTKPCHRHGAALRAIMKSFLADYWFVGRTIMGLPTDALYVQDVLGHGGVLDPKAHGWEF